MGFGVVLQTEFGECLGEVADPQDHLGKLLPEPDDEKYPLLAGIDPYAHTVFNQLQMHLFLKEWAEISARAKTPEETELVLKIEMLARRCSNEVHTYLRFIGD